jgi:hypothetical protein
MSYFTDKAGESMPDLHHGQRNLARQYGLEWHPAGDSPEGRVATLCRWIESGAYRIVTPCGHGGEFMVGDQVRMGLQLADGHWDGRGGDLSSAELLLILSCLVGRLQGSVAAAVEGLGIELLRHRARSAIACRWPVSVPLGVAAANEIAAQYLALRQEFDNAGGGDLTSARLRARALNLARESLLASGDRFLNTIAAMDLWGLA